MKSLRGQTLAESSDYMQLGVHSVEAFGQSEALTTRLRHIISDYADGPGILMELLQNADDAGATEVAFLLDEESYPTSSILGGRLPFHTYQSHHHARPFSATQQEVKWPDPLPPSGSNRQPASMHLALEHCLICTRCNTEMSVDPLHVLYAHSCPACSAFHGALAGACAALLQQRGLHACRLPVDLQDRAGLQAGAACCHWGALLHHLWAVC